MRVTWLGTGAAGGVPLYGCACPACERARQDSRLKRCPCSALLESGKTRVLLDAGLVDLHERFPPGSLTAVVLTHYHPDHVQGLFHLRWGMGQSIPVFGPLDIHGCADLHKNHGLLDFRTLTKFEPMIIGSLRFTPLPLIHSRPTFGYAIEGPDGERFAYLTDTRGLPPRTRDFLASWGCFDLTIDCSFPPRDGLENHNDWTEALAAITTLRPHHAWLTHIGHELDAWLLENAAATPRGVYIATDGMVTEIGGAGTKG